MKRKSPGDQQKSPFDLLGLGLCAWDRLLLFGRYPGANQKVEALCSAASGGGPVPTALAVFSRLGGKAAIVGVVGDDLEGKLIRRDLHDHNVNVDSLFIRQGRRSSQAYIWVDQSTGQRTVALDRGFLLPVQPNELPLNLIRITPLLLIDGRDPESCLTAANLCRSGGGQVLLDAGSPRPKINDLLAVSDQAVVSADFIAGTFPEVPPAAALSKLAAYGSKAVVITCGESGGYWWEAGKVGHYPALKVDVKDTTGAGDAFHGAYSYGLLRGWDMERRCRFAAAAAALVCQRLGGRAGIPAYNQVEELLAKYT